MISWSVPRGAWRGEPVFIIAGGTSVAMQDLSLLAGRRVILINSSYERLLKLVPPPYLPNADLLFFADERWWQRHQDKLANFPCAIVTTGFAKEETRRGHAQALAGVYQLGNNRPQNGTLVGAWPAPLQLSDDPGAVPMRRTSLVPAINIAFLLGASTIVLLGADGKIGSDGRSHHHRPHVWDQRSDCWFEQKCDLAGIADGLRARGVSVLNASPGSALDLWPVMGLPEALALVDRKAA